MIVMYYFFSQRCFKFIVNGRLSPPIVLASLDISNGNCLLHVTVYSLSHPDQLRCAHSTAKGKIAYLLAERETVNCIRNLDNQGSLGPGGPNSTHSCRVSPAALAALLQQFTTGFGPHRPERFETTGEDAFKTNV